MIGRDTNKATFAATGVLSLGLFLPASLSLSGTHVGTLTVDGRSSAYVTRASTVGQFLKERGVTVAAGDRTSPAQASELRDTSAISVQHAVNVQFVHDGVTQTISSASATVADFLGERNVRPNADDYVFPDPQTPLVADMRIEYRPAVDVNISVDKGVRAVHTNEASVSALLAKHDVALGPHDIVAPPLGTPLAQGMNVQITRVKTWTKKERQPIAHEIERRLDFTLAPGSLKVLAKGADGVRERMVQFVQREGERPIAKVIVSRIVRAPKARVIAEGIGEYAAFSMLATRGFTGTVTLAKSAMSMVATAYTAGCSGCSGITASGRPAGHGIVAVDPSVIPLGTKLYIPGYGLAIAGDTGGAIRGNRIDLGFNSQSDAMRFGRRAIAVYVVH